MTKRMEGIVTAITGSGRGIGRGAAIMMARHGARVGLLARSEDELNETKKLIEAEGGEALVLPTDVSDRESVDRAFTAIEDKWGPVQYLVNNAAVLPLVPFADTTPEIWDRTVAINLTGYYNCAYRAYPAMKKARDGAMMFVSSAAGIKGFVNETAYCATKFGLEGLAKALALELKDDNILVTITSPGKQTKPTDITMAEYRQLSKHITQGWVDPIEMAEAFVALGVSRDMNLTGHRFNLWTVSEHIRQNGFDAPLTEFAQ